MTRNYEASAALLGFVIHLRIYPIIFLPSIIYHIYINDAIDRSERIHFNNKKTFGMKMVTVIYYIWRHYGSPLYFLTVTVSSFLFMTIMSYNLYGNEYLENSIFYHLGRADHRHNFSMHFYWIYLSKMRDYVNQDGDLNCSYLLCHLMNSPVLGRFIIRVGLFLPQLLLFAFVILHFAGRNLQTCLLLQTMVFVTYNKVVTAQYFSWYLSLLPVASGCMSKPSGRYSYPLMCLAGLLWLFTLTLWLYRAYLLEFLGRNTFFLVWQASILFHFANVACIGIIISLAQI